MAANHHLHQAVTPHTPVIPCCHSLRLLESRPSLVFAGINLDPSFRWDDNGGVWAVTSSGLDFFNVYVISMRCCTSKFIFRVRPIAGMWRGSHYALPCLLPAISHWLRTFIHFHAASAVSKYWHVATRSKHKYRSLPLNAKNKTRAICSLMRYDEKWQQIIICIKR